ncbi:MAG TPA: APC family permease [Candidatus Limnocylindrales bacterium]|nr:APC family permease [Candidatus Limnocylindrales bacterium]
MSDLAEGADHPTIKHGRKPGDTRALVTRPDGRYFRYGPDGTIVARAAAIEPERRVARLGFGARRVMFGRVLSSHEELEQRLPKWKALAVFSSDVMSSVAYATEASMFTLLAVGTVAFAYLMPISLLIVGLLFLVTFSYRQTIRAYPQGGGSYIVAHANLGTIPGLVAAAALLIDYVLTVAVSVSSGVFNLASAFPVLHDLTVPLIVLAILLVMGVNLRGISESGTVFALPTYIFIGSVLLLVGMGLVRTALGQPPQVTGVEAVKVPVETLSLLLLMRAFADGCSAMTGTEAISNGTPAFKPPEWKNAQTTMVAMAVVLGVVFLGMSYLATVSGAVPSTQESVLSQIGGAVFGSSPMYYVLIFSTMGILVLAAQTSFADFPRLASILAKDGFMPRRFAYRGERLAFNAGIVVLAALAILVAVSFGGRVEALIPLYAIGVFTAFTLSQTGMVRHWLRDRVPGWRKSAIINGFGATATFIVAIVLAIAKFAYGAWIVIVIVPVLVGLLLLVRRAYAGADQELFVRSDVAINAPHRRQRVVVPMPDMRRDAIQAIKFGLTMSDDVVAVHVTDDLEQAERLRERFRRQVHGVELLVLESPYRELVQPLVRYLDMLAARDPDVVTIVLVPERIVAHWWERILYNQNAHRIRDALAGRPGILVADVPFRRPGTPH